MSVESHIETAEAAWKAAENLANRKDLAAPAVYRAVVEARKASGVVAVRLAQLEAVEEVATAVETALSAWLEIDTGSESLRELVTSIRHALRTALVPAALAVAASETETTP